MACSQIRKILPSCCGNTNWKTEYKECRAEKLAGLHDVYSMSPKKVGQARQS